MSKAKTDEITPIQRETLEAICRLVDAKGFPPTMKELSEIFEISHASAHDRINQLVQKGYLKREEGKSRGLTVVRRTNEIAATLVAIPVIGIVPAGLPLLAEENIIGEVLVESSVVRSGKHFALRAVGESMKGAGIHDGDLIIVRQQPIAEDGNIVVALLNSEATVKRLKIKDDLIELVPENPEFQNIRIRPEDDLRILGKVVGWKRN
ncbi:MAG: transcriptional repressor LexA [Spirochaetaceae bacterium]|nr:transcriptional repressor LexA [Spirochaetaceae bacterium]